MRDLVGTIRDALRQFRPAPVFAGAAVLTLALGLVPRERHVPEL